jgi:hypothetical protein
MGHGAVLWAILGATGAGAAPFASDPDAAALERLRQAAAAREAFVRGCDVETVEAEVFQGRIRKLTEVRVQFGEGAERWVRRSLTAAADPGLGLVAPDVGSLPTPTLERLRSAPPSSVSVFGDGRQLSLARSALDGRWSGCRRGGMDRVMRRGSLRAGLMFEEEWTSRSLERWRLREREKNAQDPDRERWLLTSLSSDPAENVLEVWLLETSARARDLVVRDLWTRMNRKEAERAIAEGSAFSWLDGKPPGPVHAVKSEVLETATMGLWALPTVVRIGSFHPENATKAWLTYRPRRPDAGEGARDFDVGVPPAELRGAPAQVLDEATRKLVSWNAPKAAPAGGRGPAMNPRPR